jgi:hypothetical protein
VLLGSPHASFDKEEENMRKHYCFSAIAVFIALLISSPVLSATVDDLVGTWTTINTAKIRVSKIGSWSSENSSTTTFNNDGTFTLDEIDSTGPYDYTGDWSLIKEGKKIFFELDDHGLSELGRVWTNWLIELADENGATVENIIFWDVTLTLSEPSVPKKTNIPKKATIKAKGWVSATLNDEDISRKFSYTSKVYFLFKQ